MAVKFTEEEINQYVGEQLRQFRKEKNLSQIEIAEMLGIRQAYCSSYEIGNRAIGIGTLVRLADFYGKELTDFLPKTRRDVAKMQAQRPQQPEREILTDLEKVGKFFDALAKKLDCHRDAELAEAIGIHASELSILRRGYRVPGQKLLERLSSVSGKSMKVTTSTFERVSE
ncbi:helix-turn-helix domain-containing protein [Undibacterium squillarum]|uniref:HTH cro/C1-type domain-containing protein n=1 Tax=Undibacterium squillarum TaxID=1131567 RepID=A0ABQ2XVL0_9BURK|nr:helix-turn-helix domain-containing protein [Undibacterium squillarum]GGX35079.1 hypothetical protein GCM10010946_10500 [Undibacterium squillarum]